MYFVCTGAEVASMMTIPSSKLDYAAEVLRTQLLTSRCFGRLNYDVQWWR